MSTRLKYNTPTFPCRRCKPHPLHRGISSGTRQMLRSELRNPSAWISVSARIETYCKYEIRISLFPSPLFPSLQSLARSLSLSPYLLSLPPSSPSLPPSLLFLPPSLPPLPPSSLLPPSLLPFPPLTEGMFSVPP